MEPSGNSCQVPKQDYWKDRPQEPQALHSCWERDVRNYTEVPSSKKEEFTHQLMSQGVHFLSNTERLPAC